MELEYKFLKLNQEIVDETEHKKLFSLEDLRITSFMDKLVNKYKARK